MDSIKDNIRRGDEAVQHSMALKQTKKFPSLCFVAKRKREKKKGK